MNRFLPGKYLSRNPLNHEIEGIAKGAYKFAVVIPCFAEESYLPETLKSLAGNFPELLENTIVMLVINNLSECDSGRFQDNQRTLEALRLDKWNFSGRLNLAWIDASSKGKEVSGKGGAGAPRKIGMDAVLSFMESGDSLIFALDADTPVPQDYLRRARNLFDADSKLSGAVFSFNHQRGASPAEDKAITDYELFMRYYVWSLKYALSPYAYYSIGSAMVCTAASYIACGGMRSREAGEDFYFLQALRKIGEIGTIDKAVLKPSARVSDRVLFGTGPMMKIILDGSPIMLYNHLIFEVLRAFMEKLESFNVDDFARIHELKSGDMETFLTVSGFAADWPKIYKNTPKNTGQLKKAFHTWFDALQTLRFIHFMEDMHKPESIENGFAALFQNMNIPVSNELIENRFKLLEWLRNYS